MTTTCQSDSRAPLRLVLVTAGETLPRWLSTCLDAAAQSGTAQVVLVLQAAGHERRLARRFLFSSYLRLDRHVFRRDFDALAPVPLRSALPHGPVVTRVDLRSMPLAGTLESERPDVVLDPLSLLPDGCFAEEARYGVWSIRFGESGDPRTQSSPAFWEVFEGRPVTETRLCVRRKRSEEATLYTSVSPTDRRSVSRSQNHVYWKMSAASARNLRRLWEAPDAFIAKLETTPTRETARDLLPAPGSLQTLRAGARLTRRYLSDKWLNTVYREQWALAYRRDHGDVHELLPPGDRGWADPFPVQVGHDAYIFHEEVPFATQKGTIALTVLDDDGPIARAVPILEADHHLSYPFVFQWDGDYFMIPETASRHQVELYRCVAFPLRWKLERVILPGIRAFDPTLASLNGRWWLFANVPAYGAGILDELHVFHADSPMGPWTPHRHNPIKCDVRSARPAGRLFESGGHVYRPAQDCSTRYGYAVSINRILQLDPENYDEVEVDKLMPDWGPHVVGVHTYNRAGDVTVIDYLMRRRKLWTDRLGEPGRRHSPQLTKYLARCASLVVS